MVLKDMPDDRLPVRLHASSPAGHQIAAGELDGVSVLAVDDERDAQALLAEVLEAAGARVRTAASAQQALVALDVEIPHVLVADLGMPEVDGFRLIERVRSHPNPRVRALPAAALTAYARSDDRMSALRAGFQLHLAKPIDPAELVTTIAALATRYPTREPSTAKEDPSPGSPP
jgi:CheY-like chemotaxis protein